MAIDFRENERQPGGARYHFQHRPVATPEDVDRAMPEAVALRSLREACGLSTTTCAASFGVERLHWLQLESAGRCFATRQDLWAALSQVWLMRDSRPRDE